MRLRPSALLLAQLALVSPASATWSVVLIDRATGEIGVAQATCITNISLRPRLAAIRVGEGVGIVQAWWDFNGARRQVIWNELGAQRSPADVLAALHQLGSNNYQFGIVGRHGDPVTFTGPNAQPGVCGLAGVDGDIAYAVQGNVITGDPVCAEAVAAILSTDGDLGTKLMAAMMAARAMGGDGRCSCNQSAPTSCGSPPPSFDKTAHTAFLVVARPGDTEGVCGSGPGCANGDYYLALDEVGSALDPDPILVLRDRYAAWRSMQAGVPDHFLSGVASAAQELVADGLSRTTVSVQLRDLIGDDVSAAGWSLVVTPLHPGPAPALAGPVTDLGNGAFEFELTATSTPGRGSWRIAATDGPRTIELRPTLGVETVPLIDFHTSRYDLPASGGDLRFTFNLGALDTGRPYRVFGTTSGTSPGTMVGDIPLPLNPSRLLEITMGPTQPPVFDSMAGWLDGSARAEAGMSFSPALAGELAGVTLDFCGFLGGPEREVLGCDSVTILP